MKVGDNLMAIDECIMNGTHKPTLTLGKNYEVVYLDESDFAVIDDNGDQHLFEHKYLNDFFVKNESLGQIISVEIIEDKMVRSVVNKFKQRSEAGIKKYGTTLDRNDLTEKEWFTHLQEELMDATLYVERILKALDERKQQSNSKY